LAVFREEEAERRKPVSENELERPTADQTQTLLETSEKTMEVVINVMMLLLLLMMIMMIMMMMMVMMVMKMMAMMMTVVCRLSR
jgi:hypothetical protein